MRLPLALALLCFLAVPGGVDADHCGAAAAVTPTSGRAGTTFVFTTDLGGPSDIYVYRDGVLVDSLFVDDNDSFSQPIRTSARDAGTWRVRAELHSAPECAADAAFTVTALPETDAAAPRLPSQPLAELPVALIAALVLGSLAGWRLLRLRS